MEKIVGECSTDVLLNIDEAKNICKLGMESECCAFLVCGVHGFSCIRMDYPLNSSIFNRLEKGTMVAKGEGGWKDCAWEGEI